MHRLLVLFGLMACDAGMPAPAPTIPPPAPASAIESAHGHQYAIVRVTESRPEPCGYDRASNWTFSVEGGAMKLFGGRLEGLRGSETLPDRSSVPPSGGDRYYVAEIALGQVSRPVTCNGIEEFDGTVLAVVPARDLADARAKLAAGPEALAPLPVAAILANPLVSANGHHYAIVTLSGFTSEACTNMGGTDWTFSVEGMPADYKLHGGGHGIFGKGSGLPSVYEPHDDATSPPRYFVADVALGSVSKRYICPVREATYDGSVVAIAPARDLDDARAQLAAVPGAGLPRAVRLDRFGE